MPDPDLDDLGAALYVSLGLLVRRLRQTRPGDGDLTMPQSSALARLDRRGPSTGADLAKADQISPQSMGATLAALEERGLVARTQDPTDGRRILLEPTQAGRDLLRDNRNARSRQVSDGLGQGFTKAELRTLANAAPLLERLAQQL